MANWPYNTSAWQALRAAKLAADPLCYACQLRGIFAPAEAVDHVTPINRGGDPFPPIDGLMSLCIRCHNEKTSAVDRSTSKPFARRFKGYDADGNPIDTGDEWHTGGKVKDGKGSPSGPTLSPGKYLVSKRKGRRNGA